MKLYVKPGTSCAEDVAKNFLADTSAFPKYLLVGARGGGKSTELRAVKMGLAGKAICAEVDLDRSNVNASAVTAYDLLYVSALALLRHLPTEQSKPLYEQLASTYAGQSHKKELGSFSEALSGLAGFADTAVKVAASVPVFTDASPTLTAAGAGMGMVATGLRLLQSPGVIAETSPKGRSLQEICVKIAHAVRTKSSELPLCVLIDGLEKINGEASERFRQVFEQTRLVADTPWAAVIAAPPCTLTQTSSIDGRGFITKPVWGFGPDDLKNLETVLTRRFQDCDLDPAKTIVAGGLTRIVEASGGLPRYAVMITREAVVQALEASMLEENHISAGISAVAASLGRGLNADHLHILSRVADTERLPGDEGAATLFADGRILAYAPRPPSSLPRFVVHPLLLPDVRASKRSSATVP
jgi:hypothetical protein